MYDKEYYQKNKEKFLQWQREYRKKNRDSILKNRRKYDKENREHQLELKYEWRKNNLVKYKESKKISDKKYYEKVKDTPHYKKIKTDYQTKYYQENKESKAEYNKIYSKIPEVAQRRRELDRARNEKNPEKRLKNNIKYLDGLSQPVSMDRFEYQVALMSWTKTVKKLFNNLCQVCFKKADHSHHLFEKAKYPKLALNINNGIPLCTQHHREVHGQLLMVGRD